MRFTFMPITEKDAHVISEWRYERPYSIYNPSPSDLRAFLEPRNSYHSIFDERVQLVGYCCFGPDARVEGGLYDDNAIDVGGGMRPDLTGSGMGLVFLNSILDFARTEFSPEIFRATVATFNRRAVRLCENVGFSTMQVFIGTTKYGDIEFVQMTRKA